MHDPSTAGAAAGGIPGTLVTLFRERLAVEITDLDTDLFETGVLDSLVFVDLLLALEQTYGVHVDVDAMDLEAFRSPRTIAAWLQARGVIDPIGQSG